MDDAVGDNIWRLAKFVRRDLLKKLWVDPKDRFGGPERALDVLEAHFVFHEIVGERSGAGAFVARHLEIIEGERALFETHLGGGAIHPGAAEAGALREMVPSPVQVAGAPARAVKSETAPQAAGAIPIPRGTGRAPATRSRGGRRDRSRSRG